MAGEWVWGVGRATEAVGVGCWRGDRSVRERAMVVECWRCDRGSGCVVLAVWQGQWVWGVGGATGLWVKGQSGCGSFGK